MYLFEKSTWKSLLAGISVVFILTMTLTNAIPEAQMLPIFLGMLLVYTFLAHPTFKNKGWASQVIDGGLIAASVAISSYLVINFYDLIKRVGLPTDLDIVMGCIAVLLIFEAARRSLGLSLAIIAAGFIGYAFLGPWLPSILAHRGYNLDRVITASYLANQGIFGLPLQVMARYIVLFVIFGHILEASGASSFLIKMSRSIAGRFTGGVGQVSVISSAIFGSINGSAVANVVTTGSVTIPTMKERGYSPKMAAAIEAVGSSGGQFLPPIMGAAAFIMAEYLKIPYSKVALYAVIPAFMFFLAIGISIYFYSRKNAIYGERKEDLPKFREVFKGSYYLLPIVVIIVFLILGFTPTYSGLWGIVAAAALLFYEQGFKKGFLLLKNSIVESGNSIAFLSIATALAGIVVSIISMTGLGAKLASLLVEISGSNLLLLLLLTMVISIIMGMGMPTTVVYIMLATLVVPALIATDIHPVAAHMFILFFGCMSMITPPVALASYAGAAIANANPDETGWVGFRLALPTFVIPFFYIYNNELLLLEGSTFLLTVYAIIRCILILAALSYIAMGILEGKLRMIGNVLIGCIALAIFLNNLNGVFLAVASLIGIYVLFKSGKISTGSNGTKRPSEISV